MRDGVAASHLRFGGGRAGVAKFVPDLAAHGQIEIGQHDRAARQARDRAQQSRDPRSRRS